MKSIKKKIIGGVLGAALMFSAIAGISADAGGSKNGDVPVVSGQLISGDPSQWGFAAHTSGDPSQWGVKGNIAGDPSQWGFTLNAGGTSKGGDVPVTPGLN